MSLSRLPLIDDLASFDSKIAIPDYSNYSLEVNHIPSLTSFSLNHYYMNFLLITHQKQLENIRKLSDQCISNLQKLKWINSELEVIQKGKKHYSVIIPQEEPITNDQLLEMLCGISPKWQYALQLVNEIPNPVYKEKAFNLEAQITDLNGNKVALPYLVHFKILLFTNENPPKLMETTTSGDKIMRGTVDIEANSDIVYSKIVLKEVTSHFRHGCFFMVIIPKQADHIKPLIVENLVIKARKVGMDARPRKKSKQEVDERHTDIIR